MTGTDEFYMQRCLELAANGLGHVAPNPMVGCVIVHDSRIIGEGFHRQYGGPHAEVLAVSSVANRSLLPSSVLYVNLEPCSHHGKTPPCTNLIIDNHIKKVVTGTADPYPEVSGRGLHILQSKGIEVVTGVLGQQAKKLNRRFFTFHEKKRPYIILKWAQTTDGYIDIKRGPGTEVRPTWITSEKLRMLVHKWRSEEMAVMVGTNTALLDNPSLDVREWSGRQPVRVVIDKWCKLPSSLKLFNARQPTLIYNYVKGIQQGNTRWIKLPQDGNMIHNILLHMHGEGILSVLVEGGRQLHQSLIDHQLCDEARIFTGPQFFGEGCRAPSPGRIDPAQVVLGFENFFWYRF